jgi:hypothetical protein
MDGHISQSILVNVRARNLELAGDGIEDKIGLRDVRFPQRHVRKRDLKKKSERQDDFSDSKASTL